MLVKRKDTGEEFECVTFDGTQFDAVKRMVTSHDKEYLGHFIDLDSPSGENVNQDVAIGTHIITDKDGNRHAVHPSHFEADFEVVSNG